VSRGGSLGHTLIPPKTDRYSDTKSRMLGQIASLLGGRAAEELVFKELTSGAASDISRATELARNMVIRMGMSDLGPINLGPQTSETGLGGTWYEQAQISENLRSMADKEIKKLVEAGAKKAMEILVKNREKLDRVSEALLEKETLEAEDFEELMA